MVWVHEMAAYRGRQGIKAVTTVVRVRSEYATYRKPFSFIILRAL